MRQEFSGAEIVAARAKVGMSQAELARTLGVTQATVSRWEVGAQIPAPSLRQKLSRFLDESRTARTIEKIVAHSPFLMALVQRDWTIVAVSPLMARLNGLDADQVRGLPLRDMATAEMERASAVLAERGFYRGECGPQRIIARGVRIDGRPCAFDSVTAPMAVDGRIVMLNQIQHISDAQYTSLRQHFGLVTALG